MTLDKLLSDYLTKQRQEIATEILGQLLDKMNQFAEQEKQEDEQLSYFMGTLLQTIEDLLHEYQNPKS